MKIHLKDPKFRREIVHYIDPNKRNSLSKSLCGTVSGYEKGERYDRSKNTLEYNKVTCKKCLEILKKSISRP